MPPDHWPTRDPERLKPIAAATPTEIRYFFLIDGVDPATLSEAERSLIERVELRFAYSGLHKYSLLRIEAPRTAGDISNNDDVAKIAPPAPRLTPAEQRQVLYQGFAANAHAMSSRTIESFERSASERTRLNDDAESTETPQNTPESQPDSPKPDAKEPNARPEVDPSKPAENSASVDNDTRKPPIAANGSASSTPPAPRSPARIRYVAPDPALYLRSGKPLRIPLPRAIGGDASEHATGILLHFQSLGGNDFEPKVLDEFKRRGWFVINFMTESFVESPVPKEWEDEVKSLRRLLKANNDKMFADQQALEEQYPSTSVDIVPNFNRRMAAHPLRQQSDKAAARLRELLAGSFQACDDESLPAVAKDIAGRIDQALAGNAYAVEAVIDYLDTQRPELKGLPIAMIGFSAGALATPTAAMRILDRVDAVVLIGGGANLFMLSQESSLTDGGLRLRCGEEKLPKARLEKLSELYLRESKLDPYHTAPLLTRIPVLQIHGRTDGWVPAKGGRLLHERLGRPDMLEINAGHQLLFFFLPGKAPLIADWVESAVGLRESNEPNPQPKTARSTARAHDANALPAPAAATRESSR